MQSRLRRGIRVGEERAGVARRAGGLLREEEVFAALRRVAESSLRVRAERHCVRVRVRSERIEVSRAAFVRWSERLGDGAVDQSSALHQQATNRVLEVLGLVAVGGPMLRVRPRQADERRCVA